MPAPRRRNTLSAPRRRQPTRRPVNRAANRSFFMVAIILFVFAIMSTLFGDRFFSTVRQPADNIIYIQFIDVGQGDSTLIHTRNHAVLIDGGERRYGQRVISYIRRAGITRLDYVIATHPHSDHIGGLIHVLSQVEIGTLIMPDVTHNTETYLDFLAAIENHNIDVHFPEIGDRIVAGLIDMTVLAPLPGHHPILNDASVAVRMDYGNASFLFTGDAESASERAMVNGSIPINAHVLHVGHHGSRTSTTQNFLNAVNPRVAIISAGRNNQHGHPHTEVLERLANAGVRVLRTDELGSIRMFTDGDDVWLCNCGC